MIAYVNKCLTVERMFHLEEGSKEMIWFLLKTTRIPRLYSAVVVAIVYYPRGQSVEQAINMIEYLTI